MEDGREEIREGATSLMTLFNDPMLLAPTCRFPVVLDNSLSHFLQATPLLATEFIPYDTNTISGITILILHLRNPKFREKKGLA